MDTVNPFSQLRHWWVLHVPPIKRPSPTRFFIWLAFFTASGAALLTLSSGWALLGFLLMAIGNTVLDGFRPIREAPAAILTSREFFFLVAAAVLYIGGLFYFAVLSPFPAPAPSPFVARAGITVFWAVVVVHQWRRTFT